jgi:hypothetical protein
MLVDGRIFKMRMMPMGSRTLLKLVAFVPLVGGALMGYLPVLGFGQVSGGKLPTQWDTDVSSTSPLPEYPRPQMVRPQWQSLNGPWDYALTGSADNSPPAHFDAGKILVPYPYESSLSGVGKPSPTGQRLWYRRHFTVPDAWRTGGQRVLLHFGAVNWDSSILVNGKSVGHHRGGFDGFDCDITDALKPGDNLLIVSAWNPILVDLPDAQVVGKQRVHPGGIFYTASTGIWQSVWMEPVPAIHITNLKIIPDIDKQEVRIVVGEEGSNSKLVDGNLFEAVVFDGDQQIGGTAGPSADLAVYIPAPKLWSPDSPTLYRLRLRLGSDTVESYFAMRKISLDKDNEGRTRILLNNEFVFEVGALDQGYWPDGIYTAPTDDALKADIVTAEVLGLNLLRKHAKVEPDRWYYWADKLGMLVWQDMPQCFGKQAPGHEQILSDSSKAQWLVEWKNILDQRMNHPSIIMWTTFNEGWGQHDTERIVELTKQIDPTRLVNDASGWVDKGVGDIHDIHAYPGPACIRADGMRASVNGEFGGVTMRVADHMWTADVTGYGATLTSAWKATAKYQALLKAAYGLRDESGCSAFVYTQLTDVESESNGLLTYDRAAIKLLPEIVAAANKGHFPPVPSAPGSNDLVPTSQSYHSRR